MAIIYSYPLKGTPNDNDLIVISDSEATDPKLRTKQVTVASIKGATASGVSQIIAGTNITISPTSGTGVVTINSSGGGGGGTVTSVGLSMPSAFAVASSPITTSGTLTVTTTGGSAGQYLDYTGAWSTPPSGGDTYTLQAEPKSINSVPLKLDAASGTDSTVNLTEGANVTLTRNSATEITIAATGGASGVSSFTNVNGTYISASTVNSAATGAVTVGTIDLSAVDGTAIAGTRFLSKDNTWDVPAYTVYNVASSTTNGLMKLASDTEQSVAANAVTAEASRTYGIQFNADDQAVVNVPWTDTTYTLPLATSAVRGGAKIGYVQNAKNYPVQLSSEQMFVNVPWTDTATTPGGSNTQVQFNNSGSFAGSGNLTFVTDTLTLADTLEIKGDGTNPGTLKLYCENVGTPHAVSILGPVHASAVPYEIRLPNTAPSNNQILESNSSGQLSWINTPSGGGGGFPSSVSSVTTSVGLVVNNLYTVTTSSTTPDIVVTLPTAVGNSAEVIGVKYAAQNDINDTVVIKTVSSQTIDGVNRTTNGLPLASLYTYFELVSDGANWFIK
tara:strand:+ start:1111 stop:2787 length:1677 start_codon:yes stop_codon:yes gene_type:complete